MKKLSKKSVQIFNNVSKKGIELNVAKFYASKEIDEVMKSNKCNISTASEIISQFTNMNQGTVRNIANFRFLTLEQVKSFTNSEELKKYASIVATATKKEAEVQSAEDFLTSLKTAKVEGNEKKILDKKEKVEVLENQKIEFSKLKNTSKFRTFKGLKFSKDELKLILKFADLA